MLAKLNLADLPGKDRHLAELGLELLTRRERQVAQGMIDGLTNKEMGALLGISPRTIEVHRAAVYGKTGVRNVAELVRLVASSDGQVVAKGHGAVLAPKFAPEVELLATPQPRRVDRGDVRLADIISGIAYVPRPSEEAVNVFMMWDAGGGPSGYLFIPPPLQHWIHESHAPSPDQARPLENAISYGFYLALTFGIPLRISGDRRVWDESWGELPTMTPGGARHRRVKDLGRAS
ncbi:MAG: helix-turn-helix transcriptional regulator [Fimbriimonadaceae bacterium]